MEYKVQIFSNTVNAPRMESWINKLANTGYTLCSVSGYYSPITNAEKIIVVMQKNTAAPVLIE